MEIFKTLLLFTNILWGLPTKEKIIEALTYEIRQFPGAKSVKYCTTSTDFDFNHQNMSDELHNFFAIKTLDFDFGGFLIAYADASEFQSIIPFFENFCSFIAIFFENQHQKKYILNEKSIHQNQRLESIGILAGGIVHNFNNILSIIQGYTQLAIVRADPNSDIAEYLTHITKATAQAVDLIQQILLFSKTQEKEKMPIRLQPIIQGIVKLIAVTIPRTIHLSTRIYDGSELILADPIQIQQILINLLTNSYQAITTTDGKIEILLEKIQSITDLKLRYPLLTAADYFILSIRDNGCGISEKNKEHLFEPFFTTKANGTGLGLSTIYGIVKNMHGEIEAASKIGEGTQFNIFIPIVAPDFVQKEQFVEKPVIIPPGLKGSGNILIVDDDIAYGRYLKLFLECIGYTIDFYENPGYILEFIDTKISKYQLLLIDYNMPIINGLDLSRKILGFYPKLPIVLISGSQDILPTEIHKYPEFREILLKPIDPMFLTQRIKSILDFSDPSRSL